MQIYWKPLTAEDISSLVHIGHVQNDAAKTGVTVLWFPNGATMGCDVSGGGPASRETTLASPMTADNPINAVVCPGVPPMALRLRTESCSAWRKTASATTQASR